MKSSSIDLFWDSSSIIAVQGRKNQIFADLQVALFPLTPSTLTLGELIKSILGLIMLLHYWEQIYIANNSAQEASHIGSMMRFTRAKLTL